MGRFNGFGAGFCCGFHVVRVCRLLLNSIVTKEKHGILGTPPSDQDENEKM